MAVDLVPDMLRVLSEQRALGHGNYPLTLQRLADLAAPGAAAELVGKAIKKKPFTSQVLVVQPKDMASPVALKEDVQALARGDLLLEYMIEKVCTAAQPTVEVGKLAGKVPKPLKPAFAEALQIRLGEHKLPAGVAVLTVGKKQHLHLLRFPLPLPPEEVLAREMVQRLQQRREQGSYPVRLDTLVGELQPRPTAALLKKVFGLETFQQNVVVAIAKDSEAPVALRADLPGLLDSPLLLEAVLQRCRVATNQVATLADVKKKVVPALQAPFEASLRQRLEAKTLPATVGTLLQKKKPLLFLLADLQRAAPVAAAVDFASAFAAAFNDLDRQHGGHNLVSLVDLRKALAGERTAFDAGLRGLRQVGAYTLSAAEGRHGIRPDEQEAGIHEDGTLLLYVSRRHR